MSAADAPASDWTAVEAALFASSTAGAEPFAWDTVFRGDGEAAAPVPDGAASGRPSRVEASADGLLLTDFSPDLEGFAGLATGAVSAMVPGAPVAGSDSDTSADATATAAVVGSTASGAGLASGGVGSAALGVEFPAFLRAGRDLCAWSIEAEDGDDWDTCSVRVVTGESPAIVDSLIEGSTATMSTATVSTATDCAGAASTLAVSLGEDLADVVFRAVGRRFAGAGGFSAGAVTVGSTGATTVGATTISTSTWASTGAVVSSALRPATGVCSTGVALGFPLDLPLDLAGTSGGGATSAATSAEGAGAVIDSTGADGAAATGFLRDALRPVFEGDGDVSVVLTTADASGSETRLPDRVLEAFSLAPEVDTADSSFGNGGGTGGDAFDWAMTVLDREAATMD